MPSPTYPQNRPTRREAFTLIELLVVMAVIAILASLVIGIAGSVTRGAAESKCKAEIKQLQLELEKMKEKTGTYPLTLSSNTNSVSTESFLAWYAQEYPDTPYDLTETVIYTPKGTNTPSTGPSDPWGMEYVYQYDPAVSTFLYELGSKGPDRRYGDVSNQDKLEHLGKGDDITNRNGQL